MLVIIASAATSGSIGSHAVTIGASNKCCESTNSAATLANIGAPCPLRVSLLLLPWRVLLYPAT